MNKNNILFYSKQCPTCISVMKLLHSEGLAPFFQFFCVDNNLDKIPKQIRTVPTAIIAQIGKPLIAKEIFEWVSQIKMLKNNTMQNQPQQNKLIQSVPSVQTSFMSNLFEYNENEMSGTSDKYAFTTADIALPHMYHGYKDDEKHVIFTAPQQPNDKLQFQTQKERIQDLTKNREDQNKMIQSFYENQQQHKLMEYEHMSS